jgi:hypothetical protein
MLCPACPRCVLQVLLPYYVLAYCTTVLSALAQVAAVKMKREFGTLCSEWSSCTAAYCQGVYCCVGWDAAHPVLHVSPLGCWGGFVRRYFHGSGSTAVGWGFSSVPDAAFCRLRAD